MAEAIQSTPEPAPASTRLPRPDWLLSERLAATLGETSNYAKAEIRRIIAVLGASAAQGLANQAYLLHTGAGLLTLDGQHKRTLGGIFFRLAKEQATDEQRLLMFPQLAYRPKAGRKRRRKATPSPQAEAAPPAASEPEVPFEQLAGEMQEWASGAATKVSVTIIGRPEQVQSQEGEGGQVMLLVFAAPPISAVPRGLPRLNVGSGVLAVVAGKQWKAVEPLWTNNANERLVIEGYPLVSRQFPGITVLVTKCQATSQLRQRQHRAQANGEA